MTETLLTVDGRPMLRIERRLSHPPEKVWRAVTEPAELSQWFPATAAMDLALDAKVTFDVGDGEGPSTSGTIVELDPPRTFAFTWEESELRFELRPHDDGCLLIFTHAFDDRYGAASFVSGWQRCLDALELLVAGRPVEHGHPTAEQHDHYVKAFGLDDGLVEGVPGGWRLRFERQLTRPAEVVWAELCGQGDNALSIGKPVPQGFVAEGVQAGTITAVEPEAVLEYAWHVAERSDAAGTIRWELTSGTGHGARLILTQAGPDDLAAVQTTAGATWRSRIDQLAAKLRRTAG
jgi:uncharacterized protein YndB with AHSA1/START domain